MKALFLVISCFVCSQIYAVEVSTDCLAINQNRQSLDKNQVPKVQSNIRKGSSAQ